MGALQEVDAIELFIRTGKYISVKEEQRTALKSLQIMPVVALLLTGFGKSLTLQWALLVVVLSYC